MPRPVRSPSCHRLLFLPANAAVRRSERPRKIKRRRPRYNPFTDQLLQARTVGRLSSTRGNEGRKERSLLTMLLKVRTVVRKGGVLDRRYVLNLMHGRSRMTIGGREISTTCAGLCGFFAPERQPSGTVRATCRKLKRRDIVRRG